MTKRAASMTDRAAEIEIDVADIRRRGLSLPDGVSRAGAYRVDFTNGECYLGQTSNIMLRLGSHRRTWDDMSAVTYRPGSEYGDAALREFAGPFPSRMARPGPPLRKVDADALDIDPVLDRMRWADELLMGRPAVRPAERADQRERTRPLFERLSCHAHFERIVSLAGRFLDLFVPAGAATEVGNWVITSLPSTAKTRFWRRLICLSINNVEALTIGEQFDGEHWTTLGFMTANPSVRPLNSIFPAEVGRRDVFLAPTVYATVGPVFQVGFDTLEGLESAMEDEEITDLVGAMAMRLMRRGRGLYSRFHDYNLADCVLKMPPTAAHRGVRE
jgi:hypothetical protein